MRLVFTYIMWNVVFISAVVCSDTILVSMQAKPFFYNIIKSGSNEIFAGTSDGVFQLEGKKLVKKNGVKGYITFDTQQNIVTNPDGIKNYEERSLLHLLPYPEKEREEYHAETAEHLYIVSNGTLYIFEFTPFTVSYPYMSIRSVSRHWVGGYPGIYYKGKKLSYPNFCDFYIREFNQKAFVCYSELFVYDMPLDAADTTLQKVNLSCLSQTPHQYVFDVHYSGRDQNYYVASTGKLIQMDKAMTQTKAVYEFEGEQVNLLGEARNSLFFTADSMLLHRNLETYDLDTVITLDDIIRSGCVTLKNYFLLTSKGLHVIYSDGTSRLLANLQKAHTLVSISPSELLISTDLGLFHFNTANNTLSPVIEGVEFNSKALFVDQNIVYAGSIAGLYSFKISDINNLILKNTEEPILSSETSKYYIIALLVLLMIIIFLGRRLAITRKKLQQNETELERVTTPQLTREVIEEYIRQNLATASINSINDHFSTNSTFVYSLFEPEKPGSIIQQLRLQLVAEMKRNGAKVSEISESTGLSESYIRKLKV